MWIRSQNKKRLLEAHYIRANGNVIEAIQAGDYCTEIAEYSTEEKALKVLDMIEEFTDRVEEYRAQGIKVDESKYGKTTIRLLNFTFRMPQEDEV